MLREIKKQLTLNYKDLLLGLGICLGSGVIFLGVAAIILALHGPTFIPPVGSIVFYGAAAVFVFILGIAYVGLQFNMVLKMGAVRRQYLLTCGLVLAVYSFALLLLGHLWNLAETAMLRAMGAQLPFVVAIPFGWLLVAALGVTMGSVWAGSLLARYGRGGFWAVWGIWMLISLGPNLVANAADPHRTDTVARAVQAAIAFLARLPAEGGWLLAAVALAAMFAHTWFMMRRVRATD